jgi:DNA-binding MarR family transcriptional regulator
MIDAREIDMQMTVDDPAHEALVSVWWTGKLMQRAFRRLFRARVGSEAQFNLLRVLKYVEGPVTQNDLSRRLLVDKSNVTTLIDRMEGAGLIKRNAVRGDRRSNHITLTPKGRDVVDAADEVYVKTVQEVMSTFTPQEHAQLIRLTHKLREGMAELG